MNPIEKVKITVTFEDGTKHTQTVYAADMTAGLEQEILALIPDEPWAWSEGVGL